MILVEGGPLLMAPFLKEALIDQLFLTIAPWIAGRDEVAPRPGLVAGARFDLEAFARLRSVRADADHLFLRYALRTDAAAAMISASPPLFLGGQGGVVDTGRDA